MCFDNCVARCRADCRIKKLPPSNFFEDTPEYDLYTPEELISYIEEEKIRFITKTLGVTFLGAEPLLSPHFVLECAKSFRKNNTSLDVYTCGMATTEVFYMLYGLVDKYYLRIVSLDKRKYTKYTSKRIYSVIETFEVLEKLKQKYRAVIPVVKGINDTQSEEFADFLAGADSLLSVKLDFSASGFSENEKSDYKAQFLKRRIPIFSK